MGRSEVGHDVKCRGQARGRAPGACGSQWGLNEPQYNGRSIKLGSELIWFMFQRGYSTWTVVVARAAAGRLVGGAASGRDDGGLDQSDNGEGEGMG